MNELVTAFWLGQFESDGKSCVFVLSRPASPHIPASPVDRRPGDYAISGGKFVKVGADLQPYVTAERSRVPIFRRDAARILCWKEWDGTDDGLLGFATIEYEKWPEETRELHYSQWRMRRDDFAKWYPSTALTAEARLGQFWPDREARRSVPPELVGSRRWKSAMLGRKWLTLPAGLIWAMTRNVDLTKKVQADPKAFKHITLGIAAYLATEKVIGGQALPTYFDNVSDAWLAIRDLIADENLIAEGQSIERRGLRNAIETYCANAEIPSGEAGNLILLDSLAGFTETVLGPDESYRFQNGQGRYWKRVRLLAEDLLAGFPPPSSENSIHTPGAKQGETLVSPPARGRKKGSGSYDEKDAKSFERMRRLIKIGKVVSVEAAARLVAPTAFGSGTEVSKRTRLARKFRANFGSDIAQIKSD